MIMYIAEYTKLNDIIKSNHKINIRRDLIMSFYKKMVSVCAAVALSTSIIPGIPVSADTGMTLYAGGLFLCLI